MSQRTKKEVLRDLASRLRSADAHLCELARNADDSGHDLDAIRLRGKASGVILALSYVEEELR